MGMGLYHRIFQVQETENLRQIGLSNKRNLSLRELKSVQAGLALMYAIQSLWLISWWLFQLCPPLHPTLFRPVFPRVAEMAAVYQEARIKGHNIPGVISESHSHWTGSGYLLLLNLSLFRLD